MIYTAKHLVTELSTSVKLLPQIHLLRIMLTGSVIDVYTGSYLIINKTNIWNQNVSQHTWLWMCVSREFFPYVTETATCKKRKIYTTKLIQV